MIAAERRQLRRRTHHPTRRTIIARSTPNRPTGQRDSHPPTPRAGTQSVRRLQRTRSNTMSDEATPVLDTIAGMTAASLASCDLDAREHMIARVAALVAADAPPLSYLMNAGAASEMGITVKDVQDILVAVAPIV